MRGWGVWGVSVVTRKLVHPVLDFGKDVRKTSQRGLVSDTFSRGRRGKGSSHDRTLCEDLESR